MCDNGSQDTQKTRGRFVRATRPQKVPSENNMSCKTQTYLGDLRLEFVNLAKKKLLCGCQLADALVLVDNGRIRF